MTELHICVVVGEESGDAMGAAIVNALRDRLGTDVGLHISGTGGDALQAAGLRSIFPLADIAVMGISAVIARLPLILRRIADATRHVVETKPDLLLVIDSPDFTHRVAKRVRQAEPAIPIVKVVSPSVWAWRPGRAKAMAAYVDRLLAILPFEPAVHERLGGPPTTYIGHPLIERLNELRPPGGDNTEILPAAPVLLLPGSRAGEIARHMSLFGEVVEKVEARHPGVEFVLPAVPRVRGAIEDALREWSRPVRVVEPGKKYEAMRTARAALAVSGTVTLELALARLPMVVAYRLDPIVARLRWLGSVPSIVLPNLVIGRNAFPEFVHEDATVDALTDALLPLLDSGPVRDAQLVAADEVVAAMVGDGVAPSDIAARAILDLLSERGAIAPKLGDSRAS